MMSVNTATSGLPVYAEMVSRLRQQILAGSYADGDRILTEAELASEFSISVRSVRNGIDELVQAGLLVRRQGSGTYVTNGHQRKPPLVRADTIAVVLPLRLRGYHPFFSEMLRGIREGVLEGGKELFEVEFEHSGFTGVDVGPLNWSPRETLRALNSRHDLTGIICGASIARELRDGLLAPVPMVAVDPTEEVPYVAYDWQAEMVFAVMRQVQLGARHLWVYGVAQDWEPLCLPADVTLRRSPSLQQGQGLLSAHIRHAYQEAEKAFQRWPDMDGVVVGSDYEAQGVLDAAVKCGLKVPEKTRFTCLLSRESRLVYPFPLTVLVADGYQKGRRTVELLNQHAMTPGSCADRVILRCDEEYHGR